MDQLTMLWEYQKEDIKADHMADELRRNPLRQKMEKDRNLFMERQKQYKHIEEQVSVLADRKDAVRDAIARCEDQLSGLQKRFDAAPPADLDSVRELMAEVNRCLETITGYEQEMKRLSNSVRELDQRGNTIRTEAARLRKEFEELKAQYDQVAPAKKAELEKQRTIADQKKSELPPELLAQYLEVKKAITPPLARLNGDQCSGCMTSLPSGVLHEARNASSELVRCVSCGRIIVRL